MLRVEKLCRILSSAVISVCRVTIKKICSQTLLISGASSTAWPRTLKDTRIRGSSCTESTAVACWNSHKSSSSPMKPKERNQRNVDQRDRPFLVRTEKDDDFCTCAMSERSNCRTTQKRIAETICQKSSKNFNRASFSNYLISLIKQ